MKMQCCLLLLSLWESVFLVRVGPNGIAPGWEARSGNPGPLDGRTPLIPGFPCFKTLTVMAFNAGWPFGQWAAIMGTQIPLLAPNR